jgi:hypothetical protein
MEGSTDVADGVDESEVFELELSCFFKREIAPLGEMFYPSAFIADFDESDLWFHASPPDRYFSVLRLRQAEWCNAHRTVRTPSDFSPCSLLPRLT